jgi:hypothetical protein
MCIFMCVCVYDEGHGCGAEYVPGTGVCLFVYVCMCVCVYVCMCVCICICTVGGGTYIYIYIFSALFSFFLILCSDYLILFLSQVNEYKYTVSSYTL